MEEEKKEEKRPKPVVEEVLDEETTEMKPQDTPTEIPAESKSEQDLLTDSLRPDEINKQGYSTKTIIFVALITALLVGALAGGIYVYMSGIAKLNQEKEVLPSPSPTSEAISTPEPTSTASPEAEIDLTAFKLNILNGSGKIGEATKVRNLLIKAGFKVAATGNAASFNFTDTIIATKKEVPQSVVDTIKEALTGYSLEIGETLAPLNTYDIIVTVGSK